MSPVFKSFPLRRSRTLLIRRSGSFRDSKDEMEATQGPIIKAEASDRCSGPEAPLDPKIDEESPMESMACTAESNPQPFKHAALDHKVPSLRLIRIHPKLSSNGQIQCEIKQSTVDSTYICLSYVWGDQDIGESILIDGRSHKIGQNLFSFLKHARRKEHLRNWLWIDALCIDQTNLAERTHQVQHMGRIYSGAQQIVSWLGADKEIALHLTSVRRCEITSKGRQAFLKCEYWKRAWITQEVALARRLTLMARDVEVYIDKNLGKDPWSVLGYVPSLRLEMDSIRSLFDLYIDNEKSLQPMLSLLLMFNQKQCTVPRDRIFSLLALALEGSRIDADYEAADEALALRVLQTSIEGVYLRDVYTVMKCLDIPHVQLSPTENDRSRLERKLPVQVQPAHWMQEMINCDITACTIDTMIANWGYREGSVCTRIVDASMENICTIVEVDLSCPLIDGQIVIMEDSDHPSFKYSFDSYESQCLRAHWSKFRMSFSTDLQICNVSIPLQLLRFII